MKAVYMEADIMPEEQQHYNPNETSPEKQALVDILQNIRDTIRSSSLLPSYLDGPLVSVALSSEQLSVIEAQIRTLRGIERMIVERYPGAIE